MVKRPRANFEEYTSTLSLLDKLSYVFEFRLFQCHVTILSKQGAAYERSPFTYVLTPGSCR